MLYAIDEGSPKQSKAAEVLRDAVGSGTGVISTQVLQEFFVNATKKLGVSVSQAGEMVRDLRNLDVITVTPDMIEEAIGISSAHQLSFWDSVILCSARTARCSSLLTEDLSHGARLAGVRIQNPFI